ncbi:MAG TPA: 1-phosphofructokinase family hexose kinase [Rhizomicrobium sp.]|nr:1-phosphofructokinase family hexose kinase [Rhizomicrobium sp.]
MTKTRVVTLTVNPALDLSTTVAEVIPFTKLRCGGMRRDPGGGGINVARVIRRLGGETGAVFPVGGCVGQALAQLVEDEGVRSHTVPIAGETREDFTFFETSTGKQFRFVEQGPTLSEPEWRACLDAFLEDAKGAAFAAISGSLPPGVPVEIFALAARGLKALGVPLALDTSGAGLKAALSDGAALIKPNQNEFAELVGEKSMEPAKLADAARALAAKNDVGAIALTLADKGAILATRERAWRAEAPKVEAVSTVGAGDSFLGAMIFGLVEGRTMCDAFRTAVAAGSAALLSPGTDLAHPEGIKTLERQIKVFEIA